MKKVCIRFDIIGETWDVLYTTSGINPTVISFESANNAEIMRDAFVAVGYQRVDEI
jgi:hypothetical protein